MLELRDVSPEKASATHRAWEGREAYSLPDTNKQTTPTPSSHRSSQRIGAGVAALVCANSEKARQQAIQLPRRIRSDQGRMAAPAPTVTISLPQSSLAFAANARA